MGEPASNSSTGSHSGAPCGCAGPIDVAGAGAGSGAGTNGGPAAAAAAAGAIPFSSSPVGRPPVSRPQQGGMQRVSSTSSATGGGSGGGSGSSPAAEGFQVTAAWSVAGVGTCIQLRHRAFGLHIALDMGTSAGEALGANHVFVSHSHIDHIGALLNHARARTLSNKPAKYYVPVSAVAPLLQAKEAYEALDGCAFQCEILGVQPGDSVRIHPNVVVRVFETLHRVPSQGYAFVREQSRGLKPEYRSLSSRELGQLRREGVAVAETEEVVEAAYTGDTKLEAVLGEALVRRARLLVVECTYLEGEVVWAHKWHHVHIQELVRHAAAFAGNERVLLCHVSRKYKLHDNVLQLVRQALAPVPSLAARVGVTLAGFGRGEAVTWLADVEAEAKALEGASEGDRGQQQQQQQNDGGARMGARVPSYVGADGGLEGEMPEVRTKEEVGRMLRVMSEDLGLRPRAESLAGEIEVHAVGGSLASGKGKGTAAAAGEVEEPTLQF